MTYESKIADLTIRQVHLLNQAAIILQPFVNPVSVAKMTVMDLVATDAAYQSLLAKMSAIHLKNRAPTNVGDEYVCALICIHHERNGLHRLPVDLRHTLYDIAKKTI